MSSTLEASVIKGKNYLENLNSIKNTGKDLTMKQMFDISEKLIGEQSDENLCMEWIQLTGMILHGIIYLWLLMNKSSVSRTQRFSYFQIMVFVLERWTRTHNQIFSGRTNLRGSKVHHNTKLWTQLMMSQWISSGILSHDSSHCSSVTKSKSSWSKWSINHNSKDELSSCRCSTTSFGDLNTMNRNTN